jgi:hypothetical protein
MEMTMRPPADRTAKRLSTEEWFARFDVIELLKHTAPQPRGHQLMPAPADRTAVRA